MTELYAGLDVSLELTNICVVDGDGRLVHECRVGSDPKMIAAELTRSCQWTSIKAWGVRIARHSTLKKAKIAVARKLAVIMHRMWRDATPFRWGAPA